MSKIDRRYFLQATVAGASAVSAVGCARRRELDPALLISVSEAVLPNEIGQEGSSRIAGDFLEWMHGYANGAELNHPYGSGELSFADNLPTAKWIEQLWHLDATARDRFSRSLHENTKDQRRELLREALAEFPEARLGNPARAEHVAVAILAFFYRTPEATDIAYRVSIKKQQCRPLGDSPRQPIELS